MGRAWAVLLVAAGRELAELRRTHGVLEAAQREKEAAGAALRLRLGQLEAELASSLVESSPGKEQKRFENFRQHAVERCATVMPKRDAKEAREAKPGTLCARGVDKREVEALGGCIYDRRWGDHGWCWTRPDMSEWGSCRDCMGESAGPLGHVDRSAALEAAKEPPSPIWLWLGGGMVLGVVVSGAGTYGAWKLRPETFGKLRDAQGFGRATVRSTSVVQADWLELLGETPEPFAKLSRSATVMNLLTMLIGAGVLAYPSAVSACGWALAPAMVLAGCAVNLVVCRLLLEVIERCEARGATITEMKHIEKALTGTELFTDSCCVAMLFALCAAYLVLMAENLDFILVWEKKVYILFAGGVTAGLALIKDVTVISKLSIVGVLASVLYVVCIAVGSVTAHTTYDPQFRVNTWGPPSVGALPMVFCIMLFGFHCQYALPAVRADMEDPAAARWCVGVAHGVVGAVYLFVGLIGYWGWGGRVSGNVLLSMCYSPGCEWPEGPLPGSVENENWEGGTKMAVGKLLACAVVSNLVVSLPLTSNILFVVLENKIQYVRETELGNLVARQSTVALMVVAAIACPFFKEMLGLISSVLVVLLGLLLPTAFAMKLDHQDSRPLNLVHAGLFGLGLVCLVMGTQGSVTELLHVMRQNAGGPDAHGPA